MKTSFIYQLGCEAVPFLQFYQQFVVSSLGVFPAKRYYISFLITLPLIFDDFHISLIWQKGPPDFVVADALTNSAWVVFGPTEKFILLISAKKTGCY